MHTYINLSDARLLPAVLFLVCLLALVLVLTVRINRPGTYQSGKHYSDDFDHGSFQDLGIIGLILLPFILIYAFRNWL